jgi:hypothetical protein
MNRRIKKSVKKINLLEMSDAEKTLVLKQIKEKLRNQVAEAKLWQSLLNAENIMVNGKTVYNDAQRVNAFGMLGKI